MPEPVHLEDIVAGSSFRSARRTVTEADVVAFCGVSGDFNALHTDEVFAREETPWGARIAHGLLTLIMTSGLRSATHDWLTLALLEVQRRFVAPVFFGDTVAGDYVVETVRRSRSRPDRGIVTLSVRTTNQRGETVQEGRDVLLVAARPPA